MSQQQGTTVERRKFKRFLVKYGTFFLENPNCTRPGEITDISMGGLSCCHLNDDEWNDNEYVAGRLYNNDDFFLENVSLRPVSDRKMASSSINVRRFGVEFGELTPGQKFKLEQYISGNAVDGV